MYKDYINDKVVIIISTRSEGVLEYTGILSDEDANVIKLKNVTIAPMMLNYQKNVFGTKINVYQDSIDEVIINKNYVISCSKK